MVGWKSLVSARIISDYRRALSPTQRGPRRKTGGLSLCLVLQMGCWRFWRWRLCLIFCPCCGTGAPLPSGGARNGCCSPRAMRRCAKNTVHGRFCWARWCMSSSLCSTTAWRGKTGPGCRRGSPPCWTGSCISASALRSCWAQNTMAAAWSAPGCCTLWHGGSTSTGRTSGGWGFAWPCWPPRTCRCAV